MRKTLLFPLLLLVALSAFGQADGMRPMVAPDGTVLVIRPSSTTDFRMTAELVAISPAGTQLWKWEGAARMHAVAFSATRAFVVKGNASAMRGPMMGGGTAKDEVVALALSNGAVQWQRELSGSVDGIEVAGDRVYVTTGFAGAMQGRMFGTRPGAGGEPSLVALDAATGVVLWTVALK